MWPHTPSPEPVLPAPGDLHSLLAGSLSQYAVILLDPQGRVTDWNPGAEVLLGYPRAEAVGMPVARLVTPEDQARGAAEHDLRRAGAEGRSSHTRWLVRRDDSRVWVACETVALRDEAGRLRGFGKVIRDLTARRNVEEIRSRLASILESFDTAIVSTDPEWMVDGWNEWAERLFGYRADEIVGRSVLTLVPPEQHAEARRVMGLVWGGERVPPYEAVRLHRSGRLVHVSVNPWPVRDASGAMVSLAAVYTDISERLRARAALQEREELLRNVITHIPCGVFWKDRDSVYLGCNDQFVRDYGLADASRVVGRTDADLCADPDEAAFYHECDRRVIQTGEPLLDVEETLTRPGGRRAVLLTSKVPLRDAAGAVVGVLGVYQDITERKRLEEQYRQAQKMEAVGRLAGGVAHDFNNILTVILGYGDIAQSGLPAGHPSREWVAGMVAAGERAAVLTRQLLAFSRKQVVAPRVMDLNAVVADVERMLRRLIGADVELSARLQPDLGHIRADPGQMEQVILNLAVNARDAMPRGGRLTIETADAELDAGGGGRPAVGPGRYVRLSVSDTGVGITEEVKRRLFEPFFTTKGPGKGTGLGLATVEDIVKQGGGAVEVASEPGRGSTFAVYLPRVELPVAAADAAAPAAAPRGTETVLVAEDDPGVRALTCQVLRDAGYEVIEAGDGEEATRAAAARSEPLHLLVTDVVMPGMGGREVAEIVAALHPEVRVLYLSGYTDDAVVRHGVQEKQAAFLQKPFTPAAFVQRVRAVLDRGA